MTIRSAGAGAASGCLIWVVAFSILCMCMLPMAMAVGGVSSTLGAEFVATTLEPYMCPAGTTAEVHTFETTMSNDMGGESAAVGYETRCVDGNGTVVKDLGPMMGFAWTGLLGVAALLLSVLLAFVFAAPVGALVARITSRRNRA